MDFFVSPLLPNYFLPKMYFWDVAKHIKMLALVNMNCWINKFCVDNCHWIYIELNFAQYQVSRCLSCYLDQSNVDRNKALDYNLKNHWNVPKVPQNCILQTSLLTSNLFKILKSSPNTNPFPKLRQIECMWSWSPRWPPQPAPARPPPVHPARSRDILQLETHLRWLPAPKL